MDNKKAIERVQEAENFPKMVYAKIGRIFQLNPDYTYSGIRVRVRASQLISDEQYAKFLKMSSSEIIRYLEGGSYRAEIDSVGLKNQSLETLEEILNLNFVNTMTKILSFLPEKSPIKDYLKRYDVFNIKTILRGKMSNQAPPDIIRTFICAGELKESFLKQLAEADKLGDVIEELKKTEYHEVFEGDEQELDVLEDALDRFYYSNALKHAVEPNLRNVLKREIDVKNVVMLLRLSAVEDDIEKLFICGGNLDVKELGKLSGKELPEILEELKKIVSWKFAPDSTTEIDKIEAGLRKYNMMEGANLLKDYCPSFKTVLGYVIAKEREFANIRMIIKSKEIKKPEDALSLRAKLYVK